MADTAGVNINLLEGQPSIQIISNVPSGEFPIHTYLRKSNIERVSGNKSKKDIQIDGSFNGYKWEVEVSMVGGAVENIDLSEVNNQAGWTINDDGLHQAVSDIAQSN